MRREHRLTVSCAAYELGHEAETVRRRERAEAAAVTRRRLRGPRKGLAYAQGLLKHGNAVPLQCLRDAQGCVITDPLGVDRIARDSMGAVFTPAEGSPHPGWSTT